MTRTDKTRWMSVSTPSVFREVEIADIDAPTEDEERAMDDLAELAERHGTHTETTSYPRG